MDTRHKILNDMQAVDAAARHRADGKRLRVVTGTFDPLLAVHARRFAEIASDGPAVLFAVVCRPERQILSARARAELVAALSVVDYVVLPDSNRIADLLERLGADETLREESRDESRTRDFIRHVHSRQQASNSNAR